VLKVKKWGGLWGANGKASQMACKMLGDAEPSLAGTIELNKARNALRMCIAYRQMDVLVHRANRKAAWKAEVWTSCRRDVLKLGEERALAEVERDVRDRALKGNGHLPTERVCDLEYDCSSHRNEIESRRALLLKVEELLGINTKPKTAAETETVRESECVPGLPSNDSKPSRSTRKKRNAKAKLNSDRLSVM